MRILIREDTVSTLTGKWTVYYPIWTPPIPVRIEGFSRSTSGVPGTFYRLSNGRELNGWLMDFVGSKREVQAYIRQRLDLSRAEAKRQKRVYGY